MPTERTKVEILARVAADRRRLVKNLDGLTPAEMVQPGVVKEWSVKDVLAHLAEWEAMCLRWMDATRRGENPPVPAPGVTFGNLAPLNQQIYDRYKDCSLEEVLEMFHGVHGEFMARMESLLDEELLQAGTFPWTGTSPFYSWLAAYAAHDRWGKTRIRAWRKSLA